MTTRGKKAGGNEILLRLGRACATVSRGSARRPGGTASVNGRILRAPARKRVFSVVNIVGTIPAGRGENTERLDLGSLPVDLEALGIKRSARVFALRVRGDSMDGAKISDGDVVLVEAREPRPGDIVAALIDGETTLKRFVARDGEVFLRAENPKYPDLIPLNDLVVQGVVRAVVRVCERAQQGNSER